MAKKRFWRSGIGSGVLLTLWLLVFAAVVVFAAVEARAQTSDVTIIGTGEATLSWTPPTMTTDGETLAVEDLRAYAVFWGTAPHTTACASSRPSGPSDTSCYPNASLIENGAVQSTMLTVDLSEPTTIYFAVAAQQDSSGEWSDYSNVASKQFTLDIMDLRRPNPPTELNVAVTVACETDTPGVECTITVSDP